MEDQVNHEASHIRLEHAKLKFEEHFNNRPSTLRSIAFHGGLRIFYLIVGWIAFIIATWYTITTAILMIGKEKALDWAVDTFGDKAPVKFIVDVLIPTHFGLALLGLFLSICILTMARLCRKIVKRNMYIMDLENTYLEMKGE